ncbi:hypothetical protein PG987_011172 [Apiospora arundinis]
MALSLAMAILAFFLVIILVFLVKLYTARSRFLSLQKQNLVSCTLICIYPRRQLYPSQKAHLLLKPMPPWSYVFGHLLFVASLLSKLPSDCHPHYIASEARRMLPELGPLFYLDMWPFGPQILVVTAPDAAFQITQKHSLPKYSALRKFLHPVTHGLDLLTMEGLPWKTWRTVFSPGFNLGHLMTLVPGLIEDTEVFCDILHERATSELLAPLHGSTTNLAMDVIGRVVLDTRLNTQRLQNPLAKALRNQIPWLNFGDGMNAFRQYNPIRWLICWRNKRIMDQYLSRELDKRYRKKSKGNGDVPRGSKSITDLALDTYLNGDTPQGRLDKTFKKFAISQILLFMFAGHDTTSSTICYAFYLLSTHPSALSQLRAEHDAVLGADPSKAGTLLREDPYLLNQLPYTLAVVKETLRLFPAASSTRSGEPGVFISASGQRYPTDGFMVWSLHQALHRDPALWDMPDSFRPERWGVPGGAGSGRRARAEAARRCGMRGGLLKLAMLEIKLVLVMVVRVFDVAEAYAEWDEQHKTNTTRRRADPRRREVAGERAYQVNLQHPSEGFPCRVRVHGSP